MPGLASAPPARVRVQSRAASDNEDGRCLLTTVRRPLSASGSFTARTLSLPPTGRLTSTVGLCRPPHSAGARFDATPCPYAPRRRHRLDAARSRHRRVRKGFAPWLRFWLASRFDDSPSPRSTSRSRVARPRCRSAVSASALSPSTSASTIIRLTRPCAGSPCCEACGGSRRLCRPSVQRESSIRARAGRGPIAIATRAKTAVHPRACGAGIGPFRPEKKLKSAAHPRFYCGRRDRPWGAVMDSSSASLRLSSPPGDHEGGFEPRLEQRPQSVPIVSRCRGPTYLVGLRRSGLLLVARTTSSTESWNLAASLQDYSCVSGTRGRIGCYRRGCSVLPTGT